MERQVQTSFECSTVGCNNRVSVHTSGEFCKACRMDIDEQTNVWEFPHTA